MASPRRPFDSAGVLAVREVTPRRRREREHVRDRVDEAVDESAAAAAMAAAAMAAGAAGGSGGGGVAAEAGAVDWGEAGDEQALQQHEHREPRRELVRRWAEVAHLLVCRKRAGAQFGQVRLRAAHPQWRIQAQGSPTGFGHPRPISRLEPRLVHGKLNGPRFQHGRAR